MLTDTAPDSASLRTAGPATLGAAIQAQRTSTLQALQGLQAAHWLGPTLPIVNPPLWELGHIGWFHERWSLRERSDAEPRASLLATADQLYDSARVAHASRWRLPLEPLPVVHQYLQDVLEQALSRLAGLTDDDPALYFHRLPLFHEMMHREAFCYSWQTLGYPRPVDLPAAQVLPAQQWLDIAGQVVTVGSDQDGGFVFDNEKWATAQTVAPFRISNRVVSCGEFAQFVVDGGYRHEAFWAPHYWHELQALGRAGPRHWRRSGDTFEVRSFGRWEPLVPELPMVHVSAWEAQAWCCWAGRALPSEAQWLAASTHEAFAWGAAWEWTASPFAALPGFAADPYREYSEPWFGTHRLLKGASVVTPAALRDRRFRNFYEPFRDDVFNGFRVLIPGR